jgi:DNA-binding IclR family transcriptional regulator
MMDDAPETSRIRQAAAETEAQGAGARVLRVLQCVAAAERDLSLKDLAERLELPPSTVHRLLQLLVKTDMIERAEAQTYRPGRELFRVASLVLQKFDLAKLARPFVRALWSEWQETSSFCLYKPASRSALVAETLPSPHPLQFVIEPFSPVPLAWGSMGRSILAFLPAEDMDSVLAMAVRGPLSGRPPLARSQMREEVERIRQAGCAVYEDHDPDVAGVAAPVFGPDGRVMGSLGVTMPARRFGALDQARLRESVVQCARALSHAIGSARA